ncbi:MAG: hypothetical protein ACF8XB_08105 [Planctomycetota bacterium JB042]
MKIPRSVGAAALLLSLSWASPLSGAELIGVDGFTLFRFDTTAGTSTFIGSVTPVDGNELRISHLARAPDQQLYGLSTAQIGSVVNVIPGWVYRLDDQTGVGTPLWNIGSVLPGAAAIHPLDGSLWYSVLSSGPWGPFGPDVSLFRMDLSTGAVTPKGTFVNGFAFAFSSLAFDLAGNLYVLNAADTSLWSVDQGVASGPGTQKIGDLGGGIDATLGVILVDDIPSGEVFAYERANRRWFTVDVVTGAATATGVTTAGAPPITDLAGSSCGASQLVYGAGCFGTGGFVPSLTVEGCVEIGAQIQLLYANGLGGRPAVLMIGTQKVQTPIGGGCDLLVSPLALVTPAFVLGGAGAGNGTATLPAVVPPAASGVTLTLQGASGDAFNQIGFVVTNGVELKIP